MYKLVFAKMKHWKNKLETKKKWGRKRAGTKEGMGGCKHTFVIQL